MKKYWPLIAALAVLTILIILATWGSIRSCNGHFIYALDDTYIHMTMSRNLVQNGFWSATKDSFTSSSSSILWTSSLSFLFWVFGVNSLAPFVMNILLASGLVVFLFYVFRGFNISQPVNFLGSISIVIFCPLVALIFCGIEHILHTLLVLSFVVIAAGELSYEKVLPFSKRSLFLLAPFLIMARYESAFILFIVGFLFLLKKRLVDFLFLSFSSALPILLYGLFSTIKGWYFFPNSVLLKSNIPSTLSLESILNFLVFPWDIIRKNPHISVLLVVNTLLLLYGLGKKRSIWKSSQLINLIFLLAFIFHLQFARIGWFYRYEAYLVALGTVTFFIGGYEMILDKRHQALAKKPVLENKWVVVFLASLFFLTLGTRGVIALKDIPSATKNIYGQQYQMALFLDKYYRNVTIAANDIGAINYYADIRCIDLWGIANHQVAKAKRLGYFNGAFMKMIVKAEQVKIAIFYDSWFKQYGGLPAEWIKVGQWRINNNVVCGSDTVSFYAVEPGEREELNKNFVEFLQFLPKDVISFSSFHSK